MNLSTVIYQEINQSTQSLKYTLMKKEPKFSWLMLHTSSVENFQQPQLKVQRTVVEEGRSQHLQQLCDVKTLQMVKPYRGRLSYFLLSVCNGFQGHLHLIAQQKINNISLCDIRFSKYAFIILNTTESNFFQNDIIATASLIIKN